MKNSKLRRALLLVACAVLLVCLSVGATLAYLTDDASATNTFTVGKVTIHLDETDTDSSKTGEHANGRDQGNAYNLLPGQTYTKDPVVTVKANSEESYVRIKVTVDNIDKLKPAFPHCVHTEGGVEYFDLKGMVSGYDATKWVFVEPVQGGNKVTYEFRYYNKVPKSATDTVLPALFEAVVVPGETTSEQMANLDGITVKIDIVAEAIQATGFTSADDAWKAFDAQMQTTSTN